MRWTKVVAFAATGTLAASLAACGGGDTGGGSAPGDTSTSDSGAKASAAFDPTAKGPAKEVEGAKKGGNLIVAYSQAPSTFDPSAQFYQDVNAILKLTNRALTTYVMRDGNSVLVPDLATDLGKEAADKMSWTFTLKDGLKYEDGTPVVAEDIAYGIKRSFAQEELPGGPTYQLEYLKDGDKYKGPYKSGDTFAGVEAPDEKTVKINLAKPWPALPYFASFTQMGPIPKAKDTKDQYTNHPLATGPYMFDTYTQGQQLTLKKNTNWDPATDAARHQYPDTIQFKFSGDSLKIQQGVLASNGPDAQTINIDPIDASLVSDVTGAKKSQIIIGPEPCVRYVNLDMRKIPDLKVRQAIAAAYPFDQIRLAQGISPISYTAATGIMAAQVPGYTAPNLPGLTGKGKGDPAKAKQLLTEAGKMGFELSYYYTNDQDDRVKANIARKEGLVKAGFKVKDIGVPVADLRKKTQDTKAPVNMLQGPSGWCYDWPSGDAVYPAILKSTVLTSGQSAGFLAEPTVDAEMDRIAALPVDKSGPEWSKLDKLILEKYLPLIPDRSDKATHTFGTKVKNMSNDPNQGMPEFASIWLEQ